MIFDDLLVLLIAPILIAIEAVAIPIINFFLFIIEIIVRLFISGFQINRVEKISLQQRKEGVGIKDYIAVVFVVLFLTAFVVSGPILNKEIIFIANDGHSIPFAEVVVTKNHREENKRTDMEGKLSVSRFGTDTIKIIDPRYVSKTWQGNEIKDKLIVERSKVGNAIELVTKKILSTIK
jgi:hypothetical protein